MIAGQVIGCAGAADRRPLPAAMKAQSWLFTLLVGGMYTYALSQSMLAATFIQLDATILLPASLLAVLFFHLWFYNRYTFFGITGLIGLAGVLLLVFKDREAEVSAWLGQLEDFVGLLTSHVRGSEPYRQDFWVLGLGLVGVIALITTLNMQVRFHFFALSLLGAGAFAVPYFMNYRIREDCLVLFFVCFLLLLVRKQGLLGAVPQAHGQPVFLLAMLPVCVAVVALAGLIPRPDGTPGRDQLLQALHGRLSVAQELAYGLINPRYFSFQSTGFTRQGGRLGGKVYRNDRYVMEVYTQYPVYLRGAVKDTYTGFSWMKGGGSLTPLALNSRGAYDLPDDLEILRMAQLAQTLIEQAPEALFDALGYDPGGEERRHPEPLEKIVLRPFSELFSMQEDVYGHGRVEVYTGSGRVQHVFTPPFARTVAFGAPVSLGIDTQGDLYPAEPMPEMIDYAYSYIPWHHSPQFRIDEYQELIQAVLWCAQQQGIEAGQPDLGTYLQLPPELPARVSQLAGQIVGDETNPYIRLQLLQAYLRQLPYTLSPKNVPMDADFVDYFLFEGKEGYCTYYASAFAVLARTLGIPTRYLEGYTLPQSKNSAGGYTVTNMEAHAWVEAWLPGIGWYPFEPTGSYSYSYDNRLLPGAAPPQDSGEAEVEAIPLPEKAAEAEENTPLPPPEPPTPATAPVQKTSGPAQNAKAARIHPAIWVFALLALPGLPLALYGLTGYKRKRLGAKEAVIKYFGLVLRAAGDMDYAIGQNETALAWAARAGKGLGLIHVDGAAEAYCRAAYSHLDVTDQDKDQLAACYGEILRLRKAGSRKLAYYIRHYFLQQY